MSVIYVQSLSFLQFGLDLSGEGSATWVLRLHSALFSTSTRLTRKFSMLYFATSIHLYLCLIPIPLSTYVRPKILLTHSSFSRHCTCPNHLNLASRTLSEDATDVIIRLLVSQRKAENPSSILILVFSKRSSSRLFSVYVSEP